MNLSVIALQRHEVIIDIDTIRSQSGTHQYSFEQNDITPNQMRQQARQWLNSSGLNIHDKLRDGISIQLPWTNAQIAQTLPPPDDNLLEFDPNECNICFGEIPKEDKRIKKFMCIHNQFCCKCIDRWISSKHSVTCPICRAKLAGTNDDFSRPYVSLSDPLDGNLSIYASNFNVFRVMGGMGATRYSN